VTLRSDTDKRIVMEMQVPTATGQRPKAGMIIAPKSTKR
jgi:hypothetical protein